MPAAEYIYPVGAVIGNRYRVEGILGMGGFSVVYLVQDQLSDSERGKSGGNPRFALKVLTNQDKKGRLRFLFEGELLTRLHHPALPRVHRIFDDAISHQVCILMDYIEGINLDVLRKRQPKERFPLPQALALLEPIVAALSYLHSQLPPVLHRDVKPSNLIAQTSGATMLVDFGIAKEYEPDATTTAIRHCSPGYGAPEQYSGIGTDQRADVYGLAATLYTLLTGVVPVDSLQRATKLASKEIDPLIPVKELVPSIPAHVAAAIERGLSIGIQKRFASVEEFWRALQAVEEARDETKRQDERKGVSNPLSPARRSHPISVPTAGTVGSGRALRPLLLLLLILLLVGSVAFGLGAYARGSGAGMSHTASLRVQKSSIARPTATTSASTGVISAHYPIVAQAYAGTVHDLLAGVTTQIGLTHIQQNNERISGSFSEPHIQASFTGVLDTSMHIFFTVSGRQPLFFEGAIRSDDTLVGNYCTVDAAGQCLGNYGIWSLVPVDG